MHVTSLLTGKIYELDGLDDPTLAVIDATFAEDERERSGVRLSPLYASPCEDTAEDDA